MHPYIQNTQALLSLGYKPDEIFDFLSDEDAELFGRIFDFSHVNITQQWSRYNIQPAIIFFLDDDEINARAIVINGHYIIEINRGLITDLYDFFAQNESLIESILQKQFPDLIGKLDIPSYFLFYQLTTLFTYYHEHGHILQFTSGPKTMASEKKKMTAYSPFSMEDHAMEIDADIHAAHLITFHIIEYWKKLPPADQTKENFENLLSVTASSIFIFFFFLNDGISDMYFFEIDHPHEIIRLSYIVDAIAGIAENNLRQLGKLDGRKIVRNSFSLTQQLLTNKLDKSLDEFAATFMQYSKGIKDYLITMDQYMSTVPFLVRNHKAPYL